MQDRRGRSLRASFWKLFLIFYSNRVWYGLRQTVLFIKGCGWVKTAQPFGDEIDQHPKQFRNAGRETGCWRHLWRNRKGEMKNWSSHTVWRLYIKRLIAIRLRIQIQSVVIKTLIDKISKMVGSNFISMDSKTFSDRKIIFSRKSAGHVTSFFRLKAHFWWRIWWYNRNSKILNLVTWRIKAAKCSTRS